MRSAHLEKGLLDFFFLQIYKWREFPYSDFVATLYTEYTELDVYDRRLSHYRDLHRTVEAAVWLSDERWALEVSVDVALRNYDSETIHSLTKLLRPTYRGDFRSVLMKLRVAKVILL
jgi:hypothetical protein